MTNKYTYKVPFTYDELYEDYIIKKMSQTEIAKKWGVTQKIVWRAMKRCKISSRKAAPRNQLREANNNWKGGSYLMPSTRKNSLFLTSGYKMVYNPEHEHAQSAGYVYEHILVALKKYCLKRLPKEYCVHHIDLRKTNNSPENLCLMTRQEHSKAHNRLEELAIIELLDKGLIEFCHKEKIYIKREGCQ